MRWPTLKTPTLLLLADSGDAKRTDAKRRAETAGAGQGRQGAVGLVLARPPRPAPRIPRAGGRHPGHAPSATASSPERARPRVKPPRILAFMGSGETAPTMVTPASRHRGAAGRRAAARRAARHAVRIPGERPGDHAEGGRVLRQARAAHDRRRRLSRPARRRSRASAAPGAEAGALSRLRTANLIFAGPGSPSYALSVWRGSPIPEALATRLADGAVARVRQRGGPHAGPLHHSRLRDLQGRPARTGWTASI